MSDNVRRYVKNSGLRKVVTLQKADPYRAVCHIAASISMQALANIRSLARKGKLPNKEDASLALKLPVAFSSILDVLVKNKEIMLEENPKDKGVQFHIDAAEAILTRHQSDGTPAQEIVVFDDEHSTSELVYGIARNR